MIRRILQIRQRVKSSDALIHCITHPIAINDCANVVLAAGARPIMAEHPEEVCQITKSASALSVNLGNITDVRMQSMLLAGQTARQHHIPSILDVVGIGCSDLRLDYAREYIQKNRPTVIKGNMAEIRVLAGLPAAVSGIDAASCDQINKSNQKEMLTHTGNLARQTHAVILATGKTDLITDGHHAFLVSNGSDMMRLITGTGCMLGVLTAACLAAAEPVDACTAAAVMFGICGQLAASAGGPGSFKPLLLDHLYSLSEQDILSLAKIECYGGEA